MIVSSTVAVLALVMFAPLAGAGNATRIRLEFDDTWTSLVGAEDQLCSFAYEQHAWGWANLIVVGDPPKLRLFTGPVYVSHENLGSGYVLTEKAAYADIYFYETERILEAGLFWHLRDPDGKIVEVEAGRVIYDFDYNILTYTPNRSADFAQLICTALGGAPAS